MILETPVYTLGSWQGNVTDPFGVDWIVKEEDGWSTSPPIRARREDKESGDGAWAGPGDYGPRTITLSGVAVAPSRLDMLAAKDRIKACIDARTQQRLQVDEDHMSRWSMVRLSDQIQPVDQGARVFAWTLIVTADDPRRYSVDTTVVSTRLPAAGDVGRTYPRTYPMDFGGYVPGGSGSVQITQAGDYDQTPARITITGPVSTPRIAHVQSGRSLSFNLTIPTGQYLDIDLGAKTALLNGTASRMGTVLGGWAWFMLQRGPNEIQFRGIDVGAPGDPDPVMTVTASSAWT